jgi:predicted N-acetyltransferase YhbS
MEILIRQEVSADYASVYEVIKAAFSNAEYTDHDEHNLVVRLRNSTAMIPELSLIAVDADNNGIVGHILFTKNKIIGDKNEYTSLALAPVSVLPEMQGKGIGEKLILEGHKIALELGFNSVIVLGHPGYYPRFGYVPASRFGITAPFDVPDEAFMACELTAHALSGVEGVVEYPKEFFNKD